MKKTLLLLCFSAFAFGQNFELLERIHHGDKTLPEKVSKELFPNYKLTGIYKAEPIIYYEYNKENEVIKTTYQDYGTAYVFRSIEGNCDTMLSLWKKEINPQQSFENIRLGFAYQNKERNVSYRFVHNGENNCSIYNRKLLIN